MIGTARVAESPMSHPLSPPPSRTQHSSSSWGLNFKYLNQVRIPPPTHLGTHFLLLCALQYLPSFSLLMPLGTEESPTHHCSCLSHSCPTPVRAAGSSCAGTQVQPVVAVVVVAFPFLVLAPWQMRNTRRDQAGRGNPPAHYC